MNSSIRKVSQKGKTSLKQKAVFIWLDILGYSVETEKENLEKLNELLDKLGEYFTSSSLYETFQISDGIILYIQKQEYKEITKIFTEVGKKQMEYLKNTNHLLRGGIAVGSKIHLENDNKLFEEIKNLKLQKKSSINEIKNIVFKHQKKYLISNGLSRAHKLESNSVDWPIIGTDKATFNELKEEFCKFPNDNFNFVSSINMKGEKIFFIDFLEPILDEAYYKFLISEAAKNEVDPKTQAKYIWLLRFFRQKYQITDPVSKLVGLYL